LVSSNEEEGQLELLRGRRSRAQMPPIRLRWRFRGRELGGSAC